jgi:hypothetical protein
MEADKEHKTMQIVQLRKNIKRKHRAMTKDLIQSRDYLEKQLKPLTEPLNKLLLSSSESANRVVDTAAPAQLTLTDEDYEMDEPYKRMAKGKRKRYGADDDERIKKRQLSELNVPMVEEEVGPSTSLLSRGEVLDFLPLADRSHLTPKRHLSPAGPLTSTPNSDGAPITVQDMMSTPAGRYQAQVYLKSAKEDWIEHGGPLAMQYTLGLINDNRKDYDYTYGVKFFGNELKLGSALMKYENDDIILTQDTVNPDTSIPEESLVRMGMIRRIRGTKGIYELIFKRLPDEYTDDDLIDYKEVLNFTNAHRVNSMSTSNIIANKGKKYVNIIRRLFPPTGRKRIEFNATRSGEGLDMVLNDNSTKTDYVYYDDPNELCQRLQLLVSSKQAGNTNHDNEIISIVEELKEAGIIIGGELRSF